MIGDALDTKGRREPSCRESDQPAAGPGGARSARLIRVLHVVGQLDMGGLEKLLVEFARHTDRERFEVGFLSLTTRGGLASDLEACGCRVTALEEPQGFRAGLVLRLARLFRRQGVDVVHTHNNRPLLHAAPAARLARVSRVVHTRHGQTFQAPQRQVRAFALVSKMVDRVVCVSEDAARLTIEDGVSARRVGTIQNGTDLSRFAFSGPRPGGPVVAVARLSPEKDFETLVRASAIAVREDPSFRLEVAGAGACMDDLKRLVAELGVGDHVHFLGEVRDVPALLGRACMLVQPSLTEGISLTILEAMARGLPVVATRVGGNPELVHEGETGLLVEPKDPEGMARALLGLRRDVEGGRRMGEAARRKVERDFDVRVMIGKYESLYSGN